MPTEILYMDENVFFDARRHLLTDHRGPKVSFAHRLRSYRTYGGPSVLHPDGYPVSVIGRDCPYGILFRVDLLERVFETMLTEHPEYRGAA